MKVIDAFIWSGSDRERDLFELRVRTLNKAVDAQVAVTASLTHQGDPAAPGGIPMFADRGDGFVVELVAAYHADVEPIPDGGRGGMDSPYRFHIEAQHRNATVAAIDWAASPLALGDTWVDIAPDDIILVSDLDEIPDPATLERIVEAVELHGEVSVPMRMHGFALDYLYPTQWRGTTASRRRDMAPQDQRNRRHQMPAAGSGWHFSWLGSNADRQAKLDSFSHAELRGKLDVAASYRTATHANGEQLRRLSVDELVKLRWPEPMMNGSWTPPRSWYGPSTVIKDPDGSVIISRPFDYRTKSGGGGAR